MGVHFHVANSTQLSLPKNLSGIFLKRLWSLGFHNFRAITTVSA